MVSDLKIMVTWLPMGTEIFLQAKDSPCGVQELASEVVAVSLKSP
jgi:hypothetical protein